MKNFAWILTVIVLFAGHAFATGRIVQPFCTDGCTGSSSLSQDPNTYRCCVQHDYAYWKGGDIMTKDRADGALRVCIQQNKAKTSFFDFFSTPAALAVATFGDEYWNAAWGDTRRHPFDELTMEEEEIVRTEGPKDIFDPKYKCQQ